MKTGISKTQQTTVLTRVETAADVAGRDMAPWVGCVVGPHTATVLTAIAADDATVVVPAAFDATTDETGGTFGGSCDLEPYSMYCKNTETSSQLLLIKNLQVSKYVTLLLQN